MDAPNPQDPRLEPLLLSSMQTSGVMFDEVITSIRHGLMHASRGAASMLTRFALRLEPSDVAGRGHVAEQSAHRRRHPRAFA